MLKSLAARRPHCRQSAERPALDSTHGLSPADARPARRRRTGARVTGEQIYEGRSMRSDRRTRTSVPV